MDANALAILKQQWLADPCTGDFLDKISKRVEEINEQTTRLARVEGNDFQIRKLLLEANTLKGILHAARE